MLSIEKENSRVATTKPLDELFTNVGQKINDIYIEYANQFNIDEGEYHLDIVYDRKNATVKIDRIEDLGENVYISTKYNNLAWYRFLRMLNQ
ncbi:hypothetical protein TVAGG3_0739860, partial [Trichomonas vaginalis G3]